MSNDTWQPWYVSQETDTTIIPSDSVNATMTKSDGTSFPFGLNTVIHGMYVFHFDEKSIIMAKNPRDKCEFKWAEFVDYVNHHVIPERHLEK